MAKKGSAVAQFGINVSAFAAGGKFIKRELTAIAGGFKTVATVAAGVAGGLGLSKLTSKLSQALGVITDMSVEFDNIKAASGVTASAVQKMRFAAKNRVSFGTASDLLGDSGRVWDKYAGAIRDASVRWAAASERARAAWAAVIGELAPVFSKVLDDFQKFDLIGTAKKFAESLGNGVKIVYQLLTDGELYSTITSNLGAAFNASMKTLIELIAVGGKALEDIWKKSFGVASVQIYAEFVNLANKVGSYFTFVFENLVTSIKEQFNNLLASLNSFALNFLGDPTKVAIAQAKREQDIMNRRKNTAAVFSATNTSVGFDMRPLTKEIDRITKNIAGSQGLGALFSKIGNSLKEKLETFNDSTSTKKFDIENRSIGQSYATSSMAAIGGGGYVGVTSAQTMSDNIRRQTTIQERMDTKLGAILEALTGGARMKTSFSTPFGSVPVTISNFPQP